MNAQPPTAGPRPPRPPRANGITEVGGSILVGSGKGGVGKSTVAANLALALTGQGLKVGLLDADLYGPSVSHLFGLGTGTAAGPKGEILPHESHGIKMISMGSIIDKNTPVIWRGPLLHRALEQLTSDVEWGPLDILVADLPPGTGDVIISLRQILQPLGAFLVTTPQETAIMDVRRAREAFRSLKVEVLGLIANMGTWVCPSCGQASPMWGPSALDAFVEESGIARLADIPFVPQIAAAGEGGVPYLAAHPEGPAAPAWRELGEKVAAIIAPKLVAARKGRIGRLSVTEG
ncbi:P-loop NTPase [bacterium]|nr:P-loop NTPase [bacterium]